MAKNAEIAEKNGFKKYHKELEGSVVNYENLDNLQMRIHDYLNFLSMVMIGSPIGVVFILEGKEL